METTQNPNTKALFSTVEGTLDSTKERVMVTFNRSAAISLNAITLNILLDSIKTSIATKNKENVKRKSEGYSQPKDVSFNEYAFVTKLADLIHIDMKELESTQGTYNLSFIRAEVIQFRKLVLADFAKLEERKLALEAEIAANEKEIRNSHPGVSVTHNQKLVDDGKSILVSDYTAYIHLKELILDLNLWLCGEIEE